MEDIREFEEEVVFIPVRDLRIAAWRAFESVSSEEGMEDLLRNGSGFCVFVSVSVKKTGKGKGLAINMMMTKLNGMGMV